ncbi:hypothetical protein T4A_12490 [Trichinella pseudospiralis]|uniref:Uncharacterized protein n=1 Tax=Trichinella pseudospiralis TaxID=6337 RepID=A0A0V1KF16_TRIPS|nr:hypothetical protein T4A_12490 [Trichinella pseudospiralis]KRZ45824.1 hypothetical protein T4C_9390 [Trichinella pseudospiralis]
MLTEIFKKLYIFRFEMKQQITFRFDFSLNLKKTLNVEWISNHALKFLIKAIYFEFHHPLTLVLLAMLSDVISQYERK